jgi:type II secretory pathway pseudopilin PulG
LDETERETGGCAAPGPKDWVIESAVGLATMAIVCLFGVPSMHASLERERVRDAVEYLASVRHAQERFRLRHGVYASSPELLAVHKPRPPFFRIAEWTAPATEEAEPAWRVTLARRSPAIRYGRYTVTFSDRGFEPGASTVDRFFDVPLAFALR